MWVSTGQAASHAGFWIHLCLRRCWCQHCSTMASLRDCPGRTTPFLHRWATLKHYLHSLASLLQPGVMQKLVHNL